ncbi:MAG: hypothetical protein U5R06_20165 [candidate division KSB1 bacterium]|nr:hypothetical protein [candidate division KSB1 bacterium]
MELILEEVVDKVWLNHTRKDFFDIEKKIAELNKKQPALANYLMTVNSELYNFEEKQLLLYLAVAVWDCMQQGEKDIPKINASDISKASEKNMKLISYLEGKLDHDFQNAVESVFSEYHQTYVLDLIRKVVFSTDDQKTQIRSKNKGLILFDLKTFLDCLDN